MLKEKIFADLKAAMMARNEMQTGVLRMVSAEIKNAEISAMKKEDGLSDEEVVAVLQRMTKQRTDAATQFEQGGRLELAEKERAEIALLMNYLPQQLSDDELTNIIKETIASVGASGSSDMGKTMGVVMGKVKGRADGNRVRQMVQTLLKS